MDGLSADGVPYRIYETPNATWIYAESFYQQNAAQEFCNAAGGTLAVPVTPEERQEVFTLLKNTLTPGTQAFPSYGSPPSGPFNSRVIFAAWIGMRRPMEQETWRTITGEPTISPMPWARGQPVDKVSCAQESWAGNQRHHRTTSHVRQMCALLMNLLMNPSGQTVLLYGKLKTAVHLRLEFQTAAASLVQAPSSNCDSIVHWQHHHAWCDTKRWVGHSRRQWVERCSLNVTPNSTVHCDHACRQTAISSHSLGNIRHAQHPACWLQDDQPIPSLQN